ncbi:hypothetical protein [Streptomyces sp. RPT161]|uniref:hypothetical protein n=1 Tax=Streptomyces sp. RPT161 TaxID=3015993 RepID=UPI0022B8E314|nr:hypothetical protein [Streptomyces sp. RPT161]
MSKFTWWIRLLGLAVAGGALALLVQHWSDGRPWPDAGVSAALLFVVALVIGLAARRHPRRHR